MFNFLAPFIPRQRKPVVEAAVVQSVKAPVLPEVLIARATTPAPAAAIPDKTEASG